MNVDPHIIPHLKVNGLWHSKTYIICYFDDRSWLDCPFKGSKVRNLFTRLSFSHQWSEYQIKCSKIIAMNIGLGFNYKTHLYHPYKSIQKQTNRWFDLSTICALFWIRAFSFESMQDWDQTSASKTMSFNKIG